MHRAIVVFLFIYWGSNYFVNYYFTLVEYLYKIIWLECLFHLVMINGDNRMFWYFNTLRVFLWSSWFYYYFHMVYESLVHFIFFTHVICTCSGQIGAVVFCWHLIVLHHYYFILLFVECWPHSPCCMWCHWLPFAFSVFILFWLAFVLTFVFTLGWARCGLPLVMQELYTFVFWAASSHFLTCEVSSEVKFRHGWWKSTKLSLICGINSNSWYFRKKAVWVAGDLIQSNSTRSGW